MFVILIHLASQQVNATEWRYYSPVLSSQTRALGPGEADIFLAGFCQTPTRLVEGVGQTCTTPPLSAGFSDITDRTFHPKNFIFGHFLGPESDDIAIGGWSAETHPHLWGGTLLLTRHNSSWVPVWYRSAMLIDSCEEVALRDGREILLCENEDSGMGHALHYLYTVDFVHPADLQHSLLAKADSFKDDCMRQRQLLRAHWSETRQELSVEVSTTEWRRLSNKTYCASYPKRDPAALHLNLAITSQGLENISRYAPLANWTRERP